MADYVTSIHIVHEGRALCGKPGVPADWEPGHRFTSWDARSEATCDECLSAAFQRIAQSDPMPGEHELRELFTKEGPAILRALFAWRGQGSITRWKTKPSRVLAHLATRLEREYPEATSELSREGNIDGVEALTTERGRAYELSRVREELVALSQLVEQIAQHAFEAAEDEPRRPVPEALKQLRRDGVPSCAHPDGFDDAGACYRCGELVRGAGNPES